MGDDPQALASETATPIPGDVAPSPGASSGEATSSPGAEQSSPKGETKESLLEAVQRAVPELRKTKEGADEGEQGASPAQVAGKDRAASDDDPELPEEVTADEQAKYGKTAKRRINKLTRQREKLQGELQRMQPSAQAADQVTKYLRDADISRDDFLMTLELAAAMRRGDFKTFYEGVRPYMKLAEEYLGVSLPQDLQQQVQQGHMTTQAAAMYSKERMDRAMAQTNAARQQQALQQHQVASQQNASQQQQQYLASQVKTTVDAWEKRIAASDPDYAAKQPAVNDTMWAVVREQGPPQSADHAIKIAEEAYRRVNQRYQAWAPQRRPTSRVPSSTGRTAGVTPEPKNLLDVVKQARESARL
jgi:hypothetical protein